MFSEVFGLRQSHCRSDLDFLQDHSEQCGGGM